MAHSKADKTDIGVRGATALKEKCSESKLNKGFMEPTTAEQIKYFYKLMKQIGQLKSTKSAKNEEDSKKFLDAGIEIMTTGRVDINGMYAAMQLYNKSICSAESVKSPILSASYFNRSQVLSSWKQHQLSLENAALAKVAGLPHGIGAKLKHNIQAKKLLAQFNPKEDPSVPKPSQSSPQFPPLELPDEDFAQLTITSRSDPFVSTVIPCYSYDKYRDHAQLSFKRHAKIPFAANCLDVKFDSKRRRHITTNADIKPGQIVIIENPFVDAMTTNDDLYRYTKCTHCYEDNCLSLLPCPSCSTAMFCSERCIAESKAYHDIECPISDVMIKLAWNDSLALRMTLKAYAVFGDARELTDFCKSYNDDKGQRSPLSYDAQMTDQQRYKQIYGFERNLPQDDPSTLLEEYCKVAFLYHILITMTKFIEMLKTDEDHNTLIELLYRHIRIANFGGIDLYQYQQFDLMESGFDKREDLYSKGIYELSSLIKHSCVPNIAIVANGREIIAYCCRPIAKGSQLVRSYGNLHYFQHHRSIRQEQLSEKYSLNCQCEACTQYFPAEDENIPVGRLPAKYDKLMITLSLLDYEVDNLSKYLQILEKFDKKLPCVILNRTLFTVHRIMKLKYGDVSTKLTTSFRLRTLKPQDADLLLNAVDNALLLDLMDLTKNRRQ